MYDKYHQTNGNVNSLNPIKIQQIPSHLTGIRLNSINFNSFKYQKYYLAKWQRQTLNQIKIQQNPSQVMN